MQNRPTGVGQRFLDIDMFSGRHGIGSDDRVRMIRRSDHHGISRFEHVIEHTAIIVVAFCRGITFKDMCGIFPVHIAEADDVLALQVLQHRRAAAADTDTQNIEFVTGGRMTEFLAQYGAWDNRQSDSCGSSALEELPSLAFQRNRNLLFFANFPKPAFVFGEYCWP